MPAPRFRFTVAATDGRARTGAIEMRRGTIRTPAFMPVGTAATVKAMKPETVRATGADIILGNTYHLMLRPGAERVARLGGLHKFMNWHGPILTDSGGYQVMSLSDLRKLTEEGVEFASHIDGSRHMLTPERSMEIQRLLGSDIVMAFDECPRADRPLAEIEKSMELSMRWAKRSRDASLDFAPAMLPADAPRYLMGVGKPDDLVGAVERGIDMFDCVLPTRSGRNGQAFTWAGPLNLRNARHAEDSEPLDDRCACSVCATYSRAYLHHLIKSGEILGAMLLSEHNIAFYQQLMQGMRDAIGAGRFAAFAGNFRHAYLDGGSHFGT